MRVAICIHRAARHQMDSATAMAEGIRHHGTEVVDGIYDTPPDADVALIWGWRQERLISEMLGSGRHVLVMERGFIQPRMKWTSLQIDGLNGRALYPAPPDDGERFATHYGHMLEPWRHGGEYTLVIGQVPKDAALAGHDIRSWCIAVCSELRSRGRRVVYRPHPVHVQRVGFASAIRGFPDWLTMSGESLTTALAGAEQTVTWNSTTVVESLLAGIPAVAADMGSIGWEVSSHSLNEEPVRPDRADWLSALAWRQWSMEEMRDGTAWAHVGRLLQ